MEFFCEKSLLVLVLDLQFWVEIMLLWHICSY